MRCLFVRAIWILALLPLLARPAAARVVRVENPPGGYTAVAFEFDEPAPGFWPVEFPPADWIEKDA